LNRDVIRVALVDDHPVLGEGTALLLRRVEGLEVTDVLSDISAARELLLGPHPPDVLVLDVKLADASGLELLDLCGAGATIILWTAFAFPHYVRYAQEAGASGFVLKSAPFEELVAAIRTAAGGGAYFGVNPHSASAAQLSPRQAQVIRMVARGASNDEVAVELGVSRRAVEAHLTRLYRRFGTNSRTELVARVVEGGWLEMPGLARDS